jgi:hypothetical protein
LRQWITNQSAGSAVAAVVVAVVRFFRRRTTVAVVAGTFSVRRFIVAFTMLKTDFTASMCPVSKKLIIRSSSLVRLLTSNLLSTEIHDMLNRFQFLDRVIVYNNLERFLKRHREFYCV